MNATNIHESLSELHLQISLQKDSEVCPISDKNSEQRTTDDENEEEREDLLQKLACSLFNLIIFRHCIQMQMTFSILHQVKLNIQFQ